MIESTSFSHPILPFHEGEVMMQKRMGVHEQVMTYAPNVIRSYLPDQHRRFYIAQPFLVIAARDDQGYMWATLLPTTTTSPDITSLVLNSTLVPGDALEGSLQPGSDIGILGIEFATRRRNRVNGRIISKLGNDKIIFQVDQSFGNCPQYIKPRQWWVASKKEHPNNNKAVVDSNNRNSNHSQYLSNIQMQQVQASETIFLASGYRGIGEDPRYGNDASHRGGQAGFVLVLDNKTIIVPDYSGNNHFNTIGNLLIDPRIGITFPQYETGGMLQVSGRAEIIDGTSDDIAAINCPEAERLIKISIDYVVDIPDGSFPIRWSSKMNEPVQRRFVVSAKNRESDDVISFHLRPQSDSNKQEIWRFQPGQHLTIHLPLDPHQSEGATIERTYTNSAGPGWGEYRISVKRQGIASTILHDQVNIGDTLLVDRPAGDFILNMNTIRPIVLLSNGIGITPMISMLHHLANNVSRDNHAKTSDIYWIHGARDSRHFPFQRELQDIQNLIKNSNSNLLSHVTFSQPTDGDRHNATGRLSVKKVQEIVPNWVDVDYYICGTSGFVSMMDEGLKAIGVPSKNINYETF